MKKKTYLSTRITKLWQLWVCVEWVACFLVWKKICSGSFHSHTLYVGLWLGYITCGVLFSADQRLCGTVPVSLGVRTRAHAFSAPGELSVTYFLTVDLFLHDSPFWWKAYRQWPFLCSFCRLVLASLTASLPAVITSSQQLTQTIGGLYWMEYSSIAPAPVLLHMEVFCPRSFEARIYQLLWYYFG